jgi:CO/xanthine dehydrogenase FAD-binding subunit
VAALRGQPLHESTIDTAADALMQETSADVVGDIFAPANYRHAMIGVYFKKAVHAALV